MPDKPKETPPGKFLGKPAPEKLDPTPTDKTDETDSDGTDLQTLEDVLLWVKSLIALGVDADTAATVTTQVLIAKMGNEAQSDLADRAAENADMSSDKAHEQGKETAELGHKHALELVKAKPTPPAK